MDVAQHRDMANSRVGSAGVIVQRDRGHAVPLIELQPDVVGQRAGGGTSA